MGPATSLDVTQLLVAWSGGDRAAIGPLMSAVYAELKHLARGQLGRECGHTFNRLRWFTKPT